VPPPRQGVNDANHPPPVIRKISINQLQPGMFVSGQRQSWLDQVLRRPGFLITETAQIDRLLERGLQEVSIDTERGLDLPENLLLTAEDTLSRTNRAQLRPIPRPIPRLHPRHIRPQVSLGEERRRASRLLREGTQMLDDLMLSAQVGKRVDAARLEGVVSKMYESVVRNPDALVPLARLKGMDSYASEHALATAALIIALGRQQGVPAPELEKMALGTMLKDIGHSAIDRKLMGKRGQFSEAEYTLVQSHVEEGLAVLEATSSLPETTVAVVLEHHERFNGAGYPYRMVSDEISLAGRLAAIVDTYDAMTSDRPYRAALSPTQALRELYEQGGAQFDPTLVAGLVKTLGVYPVGTLVLLESGHLGVVEQLNYEQVFKPVVNVIYHTARRQYVTPVSVDLTRKVGNHYGQIVRAESFERWGLSPVRWLPA